MFRLLLTVFLVGIFIFLTITAVQRLMISADNLEKAKADDAKMIADHEARGCTRDVDTEDYIIWSCPQTTTITVD